MVLLLILVLGFMQSRCARILTNRLEESLGYERNLHTLYLKYVNEWRRNGYSGGW